jgi:hypothetical protein
MDATGAFAGADGPAKVIRRFVQRFAAVRTAGADALAVVRNPIVARRA